METGAQGPPFTLPPAPAREKRGNKLMTAREAVSRFVHDGDSVFLGYTSWATALEWEIARQQKKRLMPVATVGSILLPLAGCADRIVTAYALGAQSPWFGEIPVPVPVCQSSPQAALSRRSPRREVPVLQPEGPVGLFPRPDVVCDQEDAAIHVAGE